jgi:hypothetical protein
MLPFLLLGCERNATFKDSITFKGSVYYGHTALGSSTVVIDNPAQNAVVSCDTFPETTKAGLDGSYELTVNAVRNFQELNADRYNLRATAQGRDEQVIAYGKPGDTIMIRDLVLYKHTEE